MLTDFRWAGGGGSGRSVHHHHHPDSDLCFLWDVREGMGWRVGKSTHNAWEEGATPHQWAGARSGGGEVYLHQPRDPASITPIQTLSLSLPPTPSGGIGEKGLGKVVGMKTWMPVDARRECC